MPHGVMKSVLIGTRLQRLQVSGIALDDAYFMAIQDNFESQYAAFTACFLRPEYTVLDIGANIGMTAAIMSSVVHEGNIYAFEPGPKVFEELEANCDRNNLANVHAHQLAISDKPGTVNFSEASAYGHLDSDGAVTVEADTVDNVVRTLGLVAVDFIKIDVEGYEWPVLRGATEVLALHKPLVYMEFNSFCQLAYGDVNPRDFFQWLFTQFSNIFMVSKDGNDPLLKRITADDTVTFLHQNLVGDGCVSDLVMTNDPSRLTVSMVGAEGSLRRVMEERNQEVAQRLAAEAQVATLTTSVTSLTDSLTSTTTAFQTVSEELALVYASASWKASAPLRRLRDQTRT